MRYDLDEYQQEAARTMPPGRSQPDGQRERLAILGLGLAGEAGESVDLIKKFVGHGHTLDLSVLSKELGDVLWYLSAIATELGLSLSDVAGQNIAKLRKRYPRGFSSQQSRERDE